MRFQQEATRLLEATSRHGEVTGIEPRTRVLRRFLHGVAPELVFVLPGTVARERDGAERHREHGKQPGQQLDTMPVLARDERDEGPRAQRRDGPEAEHREVGPMFVHGLGEWKDRRLGRERHDVPKHGERHRRMASPGPPGKPPRRARGAAG